MDIATGNRLYHLEFKPFITKIIMFDGLLEITVHKNLKKSDIKITNKLSKILYGSDNNVDGSFKNKRLKCTAPICIHKPPKLDTCKGCVNLIVEEVEEVIE